MKPLLLVASLALTGATVSLAPTDPPAPRQIVDPIDYGRYQAAVKLCAILTAQNDSETKATIKRDLQQCFVAALPRA